MMRKLLVVIILILGVAASLLTPHKALASIIHTYETSVKINPDGTIGVKETVLYDFEDEWKHGIYRIIPYVKVNENNESFDMTITDISVHDEAGNSYTQKIDDEGDQINIRVGDPDKTITGKHYYVIVYKVAGALTYFDTFDELYWNMTGNSWNSPVSGVVGTVTIPDDVSSEDVEAVCYSGSMGSTDQNCNFTIEEGKVVVATTQPLGPQEGLTLAVRFPKGHVSVLEREPHGMSPWAQILLSVLWVAFYVALPGYIFIKWWKQRKFIKDNQRIVAAWFDPPKYTKNKKLAPIETYALVKQKVGNKQITATIIDLAQRGFLKIKAKDKKNITLVKTKEFKSAAGLRGFEKKLLGEIFVGGAESVTLKDLKKSAQMGTTIQKMKTEVLDNLFEAGFFEKKIGKTQNLYYVLAFFGLMFFNIPLVLVSLLLGRKMAEMTFLGVEKYSEALSLKNFLVSQDDQFDFQAKEQMFFEKLLAYATAFGVEDIWEKRFGDFEFKKTDWYEGDRANLVDMTHAINSGVAKASSSSSPHSSSGFSSGFSGGSSGGGGGGGGGGSW
jgi:uncharacterized membrane protein